jgi:hypothetical protein
MAAMKSATSHTWIWLIVALIARLGVMGWYFTHHDQNLFFGTGFELALTSTSIVTGRGLSSPFGGSTGPTAFLAPGYPLVISGIFAFTGVGTRASAVLIMALQALFSCLTVALVMQIARKVANVQVANLSGVICALAPPLLFAFTIFWDTSITILLMAGTVALVLSNVPGWLRGLYYGIASLFNPVLLPSMFALEAWAAIRRRSFPTAAILVFVLTFSVWPIRNLVVLHSPVLLRSNPGLELWMGNRSGADGRFTKAVHPVYSESERSRYASIGEIKYMQEKQRLAITYIREHPGTFVALTAKRFVRFWLGLTPEGGDGIAFFTIFAALGWFFLRPCFPLLLPLIVYPLPYYITHAETRYRYPIDPLLMILTAYAVTRLIELLSAPSPWKSLLSASSVPSGKTD